MMSQGLILVPVCCARKVILKGVYSKALFCSTAVEDPGEENEDVHCNITVCELLRPPQDAAQEVCLLSSFIRPFGQLIRH